MGLSESHEAPPSSSITEVYNETFAYLWGISNFQSLLDQGSAINSAPFFTGKEKRFSWILQVSPLKRQMVDYVGIFIYAVRNDHCYENRSVKASYDFRLLAPNKEHLLKSLNQKLFLPYGGIGFSDFVKVKDLSKYLDNGTLKIEVKIHIIDPKQNIVHDNRVSSKRHRTPDDEDKYQTEIYQNDMKKLKSDPVGADVYLQTATKQFRAHKAILSCRSKVFAELFNSKDWNDKDKSIEITSFSDAAIEGMLDHIYLGEVKDLKTLTAEYYRIGEEYKLEGLKELALNELMNSLNINNAVEYLLLAQQYNNDSMKTELILFINKNKREVVAATGFETLNKVSPDVLLELYTSD